MLLVPLHILLSICADTETESDTFISKLIATFRGGNLAGKIKVAFRSNKHWGPANLQEKLDWQNYCGETDLNYGIPEFVRRKTFNYKMAESAEIVEIVEG